MFITGVLVCMAMCVHLSKGVEKVEIFTVARTQESARALLSIPHDGGIKSSTSKIYKSMRNIVLLRDAWVIPTKDIAEGNRQLTIGSLIDASISRQGHGNFRVRDIRVEQLNQLKQGLSTLMLYDGFEDTVVETIKSLALSTTTLGVETVYLDSDLPIDFSKMVIDADRDVTWRFGLNSPKGFCFPAEFDVEKWPSGLHLDSRIIRFSYDAINIKLTKVFTLITKQLQIVDILKNGILRAKIEGLQRADLGRNHEQSIKISYDIHTKLMNAPFSGGAVTPQTLFDDVSESISVLRLLEYDYLSDVDSSEPHYYRIGKICVDDDKLEDFIHTFVVDSTKIGVPEDLTYDWMRSRPNFINFADIIQPGDGDPIRFSPEILQALGELPADAHNRRIDDASLPVAEPPPIVEVQPPVVEVQSPVDNVPQAAGNQPPQKFKKLRAIAARCKNPFSRQRRDLCELYDPSNYELDGLKVKFMKQYDVELVRHLNSDEFKIQELSIFHNGYMHVEKIQFPVRGAVMTKYLQIQDPRSRRLNSLMYKPDVMPDSRFPISSSIGVCRQ